MDTKATKTKITEKNAAIEMRLYPDSITSVNSCSGKAIVSGGSKPAN